MCGHHIYLAYEAREDAAGSKAMQLESQFGSCFFRISHTIHPSDLAEEAQGKSSNESWAAKQASRDYTHELEKQHIIITVMDADIHLSSRYFTHIRKLHEDHPEIQHATLYVPPIIFDRNLHCVPLPVRIADIVWAIAGISCMYPGSSVCIPTSVCSLPMGLVEHVGGWDCGPGAIGEDLHMFLKCFFALSGNLTIQTVYVAASQCNISSGFNGVCGYMDGLLARYKQALRHMWGALDSGFAIRQAVTLLGKNSASDEVQRDQTPLSGQNSNWTAFYSLSGFESGIGGRNPYTPAFAKTSINMNNLLVVFYRLFEAHLLPIHLAFTLLASSYYVLIYPQFLIPNILRLALHLSAWCRLFSFCVMLAAFYQYEQYHLLCVGFRIEEMRMAGLLEEMQKQDRFSPNVFLHAGILEAMSFPIGGFLFGAIPLLQAIFSHLFTERLQYTVSLKP